VKTRANTRVTILRGGGTDSFGDPVDLAKTVASGVTASIMERNKTVTNPVDGTVRQVRYYVGRVPSGTDIRTGDRVRDERTNTVYVFDASSEAANPVRGSDIRLDLRRVT
jgi:hypothetical protein